MVGAHRTDEAGVAQRLEHGPQIYVTRRMRCLVELPVPGDAHVAAVRKVDAGAELAHHRGKIVFGEGAERARAESDAVRGAVHELRESFEIDAAADDARQPEDGPGWIVGVDRHPDARLLGDGDHALEEVGEMIPQPFRVHLAVRLEQPAELAGIIGRRPPG